MASPNTIGYSIAKETVAGTTDAPPAFKRFPHVLGNNLDLTAENIQSPIIQPGGAMGQSTKDGYKVEGSLKTHFQRDDGGAGEALLESAFAGTFTSGVLKAGTSPVSLTVEKTFVEQGVSIKRYFRGCQVAKFGLSVSTGAIAEATFDIVGMTANTNVPTAATYAAAASSKRFTGLDVKNVTVAGLTANYLSANFSMDSERDTQNEMGSPFAIGIGTSGTRKTSLELTIYRRDYSPETLFVGNDTPFAVSFEIGSGANGYRVTLPAVTCEVPKDGEDGSKMTVSLTFWAGYSAADGTDAIITKLS